MRVLFVSGIDGFCHRYHVLHRAAQLARHGVESTVRSFVDPRLSDDAAAHDVLFLYRVPETAATRAAIAAARGAGASVVGSVDDLIFSAAPEDQPSLERLGPDERALWRRGVERYRATLVACDAFVGPTEPLLDAASALGLPAYLHRNALSRVECALGDRAAAAHARRASAGGPVWLGYLSGTPTHDRDFALVAPLVRDLLRSEARVRLRIVGPLDLGRELSGLEDRIDRVALVSWTDLPEVIAGIDVVLVPLEIESRFARAKGEVKYLEAAAVARPVVASPTPAFRHAIGDGLRGRLAADARAWAAALRDLVADPELRRALGAAARADIEARWDEAERGRELIALLEEIRAAHRRPVASAATAAGCAERAAPLSGAAVEVVAPARLALEPDAQPLRDDGAPASVSPPLGPRAVLAQRLAFDASGLIRVDVFTVTYGQSFAHQLDLRLRRADGAVVASRSVAAGEAPDRGWLAFELPGALAMQPAGEAYVLELAAAESGAGNALSFGLTNDPVRASEPALLDGAPLAGALALRAFRAWGLDRASARDEQNPAEVGA